MGNSAVPEVLQRIRAEFLEMPGLMLTPAQVTRLCGVDGHVCQNALAVLVQSGFLAERSDGAFGRFRNPEIARTRALKAGLQRRPEIALSRVRLKVS